MTVSLFATLTKCFSVSSISIVSYLVYDQGLQREAFFFKCFLHLQEETLTASFLSHIHKVCLLRLSLLLFHLEAQKALAGDCWYCGFGNKHYLRYSSVRYTKYPSFVFSCSCSILKRRTYLPEIVGIVVLGRSIIFVTPQSDTQSILPSSFLDIVPS